MMADVTREEFAAIEARVRVLEEEVTGEKAVTRHIFEQTGHTRDETTAIRVDLATLRLQSDRLGSDVVLIKATQTAQGSLLNILRQDVREIRSEMGEMRAALHRQEERLDRVEARLDRVEARLDRHEELLGRLAEDVAHMRQDVTAILAALSTRGGA